MTEKLKFVIKDTMDGVQVGFFDWTPERDYLFDELNVICKKRKNNESFNLKQIHDIYEKDRDFFPALVMMGELCLNINNLDMASKYLNEAIIVAEKLIPEGYEGKIYSEENPYGYYSTLKGISTLADKQGNQVMIEKCLGIWVTRLPEYSFATPKLMM